MGMWVLQKPRNANPRNCLTVIGSTPMIKNWFNSIFTKKSLTLITSPPSMFLLEIAPSSATKPGNLGKSGTPSPNAMARISSSSHSSIREARSLPAKSAVVLEHGTRNEAHASEKVQATTTTTRKRKRIADGDAAAKNTMFQKHRVEEDAQKQQIMGFNGEAKTVSQEKNQQLHLELEPVFDNDITSTSNPAPSTVFTLDHAENLQPSDIDGDAAATENDDFHSEIFGLLDLSGYCDEEAGVPSTLETAEASAYWAEATSTLDQPFTADAVVSYLELGVSDSSLTNWSGSFSQMPNAARRRSYRPDSRI
ncbi:hypothetical protein OIU79_011608 [Salix purpurea]|uniref:Uncharacterized protein n=1 Tax=Salix purpurea TaxID=77065 RepID=A0A9Q0T219_SALPP|nr:hypothetical protein OIU79_011608 [Salix purpurea]